MATALRQSGSSAKVREVAIRKYVLPNARRRKPEFSISVRSLLQELKEEGFPVGNTPQVCTAIRSRKFLQENNLAIERVDGPPSGQSTSVVVHYRFRDQEPVLDIKESPEKKAIRLARESVGLLQPAIDQFGGADGLLAWIRSEERS